MSWVELHAHSAFSFLDGASQPDELAVAAADLGHTALALTDHDNLCGALEFAQAAVAAGIKPITGAEVTVVDELQRIAHVTLLARTAAGYRNLCRLLTRAYAPRGLAGAGERARAADVASAWTAPPGRVPSQATRVLGSPQRPHPMVTIDQLCEHADGITLLTGCARRGLLIDDVQAQRPARAIERVTQLQCAFGTEHVYIELQLPQHRGDSARNRGLRAIAEAARAPVVATGNVHAHTPERARLHEVLIAIAHNTTLEAASAERPANLATCLRSPAEMQRRFRDHADAVAATQRIADSIEFDLTRDLGYRFPDMVDGSGQDADEVLAGTCVAELERRYAGRATLDTARARLADELRMVRRHGLAGFFLLHKDVLDLAREAALHVRGPGSLRELNPPGRGRGSSVESIICYLTGLSHVDPIESGLTLGRFLNEDMASLPDIDLDFARDIRHEVLKRIVDRYGADRCAMVAAHATFRTRSAVRDVGRALGLPQAELTRIVRLTDSRSAAGVVDVLDAERHAGPRWQAFRMLCTQIARLPRQIGQHSGGVIVSTDPLEAMVPIQPAAMPHRQICQWDKDSCADAGFLKIDVLGLGMLSAVEECIETIALTTTDKVDLSRIDYGDRAVFRDIRMGDTVGTFQIESRAQIQSLKRVQPTDMHDLAIQVALIRPGPIIGQSVNPYVKLREAMRRGEAVEPQYDHELLRPVLEDTYGAIIFQDQVIGVSMALAGFSAGEADGLRRAMTRKRAAGSVEAWRGRFEQGAAARGVDQATATRVFDKLTGFAEYGFPKAHSVAFALLAYQSAWLRHRYPAHFYAALLNAQPMGFYPPDSLLRDAARRGVRALGVDVNASDALCVVRAPSGRAGLREAAARAFGRRRAGAGVVPELRIGLGCIAGIGYADALSLQRERDRGGEFAGIEDLARRAPLRTHQLERLVMAGACDSFGAPRRELLWSLGLVARGARTTGQGALEIAAPDAVPELAQLSLWEQVALDFQTQGLSVRAHPVQLLRPLLGERVMTAQQAAGARHRQVVELVGAVVARQQPRTARGVVFLLLEDETGSANVIVSPELYKAERISVRAEPILRVTARVERHDDVINFVALEIHRLPRELRPRAPKRVRGKYFS